MVNRQTDRHNVGRSIFSFIDPDKEPALVDVRQSQERLGSAYDIGPMLD